MGLIAEWTEFSKRIYRLTSAAQHEALRSGSTEVLPEHVLNALAIVGGESAEFLAGVGFKLTSSAAKGDPQSDSTHDAQGLRFSREAGQAAAQLRWRNRHSDLPVLEALMNDMADPPLIVLQDSTGLNAMDLRRALEDYKDHQTPQFTRRGQTVWKTEVSRVAPVQAELLWSTVQDPFRRPEWDSRLDTLIAVDGGCARYAVKPPYPAESNLVYRIMDCEPQRHIEWQVGIVGDAFSAEILRVDILDHGPGARVLLRRRPFGKTHGVRASLRRAAAETALDRMVTAIIQASRGASTESRTEDE